jgi:hypothetical protein
MRPWNIHPQTIALTRSSSFLKQRFWVLLLALIATACTHNDAYRTVEAVSCKHDCDPNTYIEQHDDQGFDLAFVEFSERGNVISRERMNQVLEFVGKRAQYDPEQPYQGVLTVVFAHGWKHNARAEDTNVASFRQLLSDIAELSRRAPPTSGGTMAPPRRVIGVYVGWRGLSIDWGEPLTSISYWERKATAEQVARGGVTELLLRLEREVIDDDPDRPLNRNLYFVTGHSFGGAIVLAALNDIMLERIVSGIPTKDDAGCVETRSFGHGVVLLNPAIEANEAMQLKELVAETCFGQNQVRLLHVISSDADAATNKAFRIGQILGVNLTWKQRELYREFRGKQLQFQETDLDTITVGNFKPFQTGQLDRSASDADSWDYSSCVGDEPKCLDEADRQQHIPVRSNEPLAFIQTDSAFIADHNDVFNNNVAAYLAAIIAEARYKLLMKAKKYSRRPEMDDKRLPTACKVDNFGRCFEHFQLRFKELEAEHMRQRANLGIGNQRG